MVLFIASHSVSSASGHNSRSFIVSALIYFILYGLAHETIVSDAHYDPDSRFSDRIVGGTQANQFLVKHMANIVVFLKNEAFDGICTATVLTSRWLLTAAHCLVGADLRYSVVTSKSYVFVGQMDPTLRRHNTRKKSYNVQAFYVHRFHNGSSFYNYRNDIAMIRLAEAIPAGTFRPVALARFPNHVPRPWSTVMAAGYGTIAADGPIPPRVKKTPLVLAPYEVCKPREHAYMRPYLSKRLMICAVSLGFPKAGRTDTCSGDSGGPLYYFDYRIRRVRQFGITSFGTFQCAYPGSVTWYTRISAYYPAIMQNLRGNRKNWKIIPFQ